MPPALGIAGLAADPPSSLCLHLRNKVVVSSGSRRSLFTASEVDRADRRSRVRSTLRASIAASDIARAERATPNAGVHQIVYSSARAGNRSVVVHSTRIWSKKKRNYFSEFFIFHFSPNKVKRQNLRNAC